MTTTHGTISQQIPATALRSVLATLNNLGAVLLTQEHTPGAVGYITLTYTKGQGR